MVGENKAKRGEITEVAEEHHCSECHQNEHKEIQI